MKGRHVREYGPLPVREGDWPSAALHVETRVTERYCPRCNPVGYAAFRARHKAES